MEQKYFDWHQWNDTQSSSYLLVLLLGSEETLSTVVRVGKQLLPPEKDNDRFYVKYYYRCQTPTSGSDLCWLR